MGAGVQDITIEVASSFRMSLTWTDENSDPIDLTGKTAHMQIRAKVGAVDPPMLDATDVADPDTGTILTLGGSAGTVDIFLSSADTALLTGKKAVYDLYIITTAEDKLRILEGAITLSPTVTVG